MTCWLDEYAPDEAMLYEIASGQREVWVDAVNEARERVAFRVTVLEGLEAAALAYNEGAPTAYAVRAGMTLDEAEAANAQSGCTVRYAVDIGDFDAQGALTSGLIAALLPYVEDAPLSEERAALRERNERLQSDVEILEDGRMVLRNVTPEQLRNACIPLE